MTEMRRILVAFDGGEPARRALETGIALATRFEAPLAIVSVIPHHPGRSPIDPWDDPAVHDRQLDEAQRIAVDAGLEAELIKPAGDPARAIERVAEMGRFDTIVVGSRGLDAVGRLLQGSVSEHVATHAKATVVVAR